MLLVVDVGNTQTHFGTYDGTELVEHWRFATVRTSTSDELGAALRSAARAARALLRRHRRVDRLLDRPAAAAGVGGDGRPLPRATRCPWSARACAPACRSASTTRASSAPTGSSTRSPPTRRSAAPAWSWTSAPPLTFDVVSADGEYLGGIIFPGVEISLEALTARAAALPTIDLTPPRGVIGKGTVDAIRVRRHLRLRRRGRRHRRPAARGARGGRRRSPPAASPTRSSRTASRSTRSTTCSRSRGCG